MRTPLLRLLLASVCLAPRLLAADPAPSSWKAGAAEVDITPQGPVWLAGFALRRIPSQGAAQAIHTKALALEDAAGRRFVLVTLDLVGVPRRLRIAVERQAQERFQLPPEGLLINASHTHSAPAFSAGQVEEAFRYHGLPVDPVYVQKAVAYEGLLEGKVVEAIGQALSHLQPAVLDYSHARAGFAMNRRLPAGGQMLHEACPDGPVDHAVPVLRVSAPDGTLRAILFGYACHNTSATTVSNVITGDYAGFAQDDLEKDHPGAIALFVQGAAGDQNPYPRGPLTYPERYGRSLADAVEAALAVKVLHRIDGPVKCALGHADLEYAECSRAELERRGREGDAAEKASAAKWLAILDREGKLPRSYPCPVQVVRLGSDLTFVAVGGEPTVGYALRLKRELDKGGNTVWFAGYSNDVFGYVGTRQVLLTGGYEGYHANVDSLAHPGPFALSTEDRIVGEVYDLIRDTNN